MTIFNKLKVSLLALLLILFVAPRTYAHGISTATAKIEMRPGNLIELKIQFNLIDLLNHKEKKYSLPLIASLSEEKFGLFYKEIVKLFKQNLMIKIADQPINSNARLPTQAQMFALLKREFIETKFSKNQQNIPYTFSDRRFYQIFYFDFRLKSPQDLEKLSIQFPQQLGTIYTTFTQSSNQEVHQGIPWKYQLRNSPKQAQKIPTMSYSYDRKSH